MAKGSSKVGGGKPAVDEMNVPYDEWGEMLTGAGDAIPVYDDEGRMIGEIYDDWQSEYEPVTEKANKKAVMALADGEWTGETYGDDDTRIYIQYDNGDLVDATEDLKKGKKYKKKGIVGMQVTTPWQAAAWGVEYVKNPNYSYGGKEPRYIEQPMTIQITDRNGDITGEASNVVLNYETTRERKVRLKKTWNNKTSNGYGGERTYTKTEVIRASEWKDSTRRL